MIGSPGFGPWMPSDAEAVRRATPDVSCDDWLPARPRPARSAPVSHWTGQARSECV